MLQRFESITIIYQSIFDIVKSIKRQFNNSFFVKIISNQIINTFDKEFVIETNVSISRVINRFNNVNNNAFIN